MEIRKEAMSFTTEWQIKIRVIMRFVFVDQNGRKEKQYTH